jgi:hypothetical protein
MQDIIEQLIRAGEEGTGPPILRHGAIEETMFNVLVEILDSYGPKVMLTNNVKKEIIKRSMQQFNEDMMLLNMTGGVA